MDADQIVTLVSCYSIVVVYNLFDNVLDLPSLCFTITPLCTDDGIMAVR